jgi:NitT/TauT family transport system permease protein
MERSASYKKPANVLIRSILGSKGSLGFVSVAFALTVWYLYARFGGQPAFILPSPNQVGLRFLQSLGDGTLFRHAMITTTEILVGLAIGMTAAVLIGYLLAKSLTFERLLSPYIVASQAVPIVAIAPLLVIWFGPGISSKILICALIVFFPILVNTIVGLRSVPEDLHDLMRSLQASRWQTIKYLEFPAALPVLLGGLRIGAALAVIGAVVGEFAGADRGLGFLISLGRGQYDTALVFVAVFSLIILALTMYGIVIWFESRWISWQQRQDNSSTTH